MQSEKIIAKTLFPISTIVIGASYLLLLFYVFTESEKVSGVIFYTLIFSLIFWVLWKFRNFYDGQLILTEKHLVVRYVLPTLPRLQYELSKINSNITIKRMFKNQYIGSLPTKKDYFNYEWYFQAEKYEISFEYADQGKTIFIIQPNIIRFKAFLKRWGHAINENIDNSDNRDIKSIIVGLLLLDDFLDE